MTTRQPAKIVPTTFTLEQRLMSAAVPAWGMSPNMPQEVYVRNYNKILEDSWIGWIEVQLKTYSKRKERRKRKTTI